MTCADSAGSLHHGAAVQPAARGDSAGRSVQLRQGYDLHQVSNQSAIRRLIQGDFG